MTDQIYNNYMKLRTIFQFSWNKSISLLQFKIFRVFHFQWRPCSVKLITRPTKSFSGCVWLRRHHYVNMLWRWLGERIICRNSELRVHWSNLTYERQAPILDTAVHIIPSKGTIIHQVFDAKRVWWTAFMSSLWELIVSKLMTAT